MNIIELKTLEKSGSMCATTLMRRCTSLLKCDDSLEYLDKETPSAHNARIVEYKSTNEWQQAYQDLKLILS